MRLPAADADPPPGAHPLDTRAVLNASPERQPHPLRHLIGLAELGACHDSTGKHAKKIGEE